MNVDFKYSQSELVAYLITKGYKISYIEIKKNDRYINNYKVFITICGEKENLISLENEFKTNSNINICMKDYINNLSKIKKIIINKINKAKGK